MLYWDDGSYFACDETKMRAFACSLHLEHEIGRMFLTKVLCLRRVMITYGDFSLYIYSFVGFI